MVYICRVMLDWLPLWKWIERGVYRLSYLKSEIYWITFNCLLPKTPVSYHLTPLKSSEPNWATSWHHATLFYDTNKQFTVQVITMTHCPATMTLPVYQFTISLTAPQLAQPYQRPREMLPKAAFGVEIRDHFLSPHHHSANIRHR